MEIPVVVGPGGGRSVTAITSSVETFFDLSSFAGKYVTVLADQNCRVAMVPASGAYTLSMSGALTLSTSAEKIATPGAVVGAPLYANVEKPLFVSKKFTRLAVRAVSTSTASFEICENSDGLSP